MNYLAYFLTGAALLGIITFLFVAINLYKRKEYFYFMGCIVGLMWLIMILVVSLKSLH